MKVTSIPRISLEKYRMIVILNTKDMNYSKKGIKTMIIYRAKDYQDMSRKAANIISAQIIMKPNCVLGLATGT